jgi:hypothetical protein
MHFYAFLTRCICAYCSACWFRCILIQLHFNAFARLTSSDAFRLHSPSEAHVRVHAACFLVSLALSPLGFFVYVCVVHESGPHASVYPHACWGIFMHSHASWSSHEASIMLSSYHRVAHPNQAIFLLRELGIQIYAHECIIVRMQRINMHLNALICITYRMHTYGNAHECITCTKCMIMQQRMEMHRIIDAW